MASNDGLSWDLTLSESGQPADDEPSYATAAVGDFAPVEVRPSPDAFLSCVDGRAREAEEDGVAQLDLAWQYELRTPAAAGTGGPDDDLSSAVKAFEVGALRAVAGDLALSRCEYLGGRRRRHARRRRGLRKDGARVAAAAAPRASNDAPGSGVAGVGSYPHDTEDTDHECEELASDEDTSCTLINGRMTAWILESHDPSDVEEQIYASVQRYSEDYQEGGVQVAYRGTTPASLAIGPIISSANRDDGARSDLAAAPRALSPGAVAGMAAAGLLVALAVVAMAVKKRRRAQPAEEEEPPAEEVRDKSLAERPLALLVEAPTVAGSQCDWSERSGSQLDEEGMEMTFENGTTMGEESVQILPNETMATADSFEVQL